MSKFSLLTLYFAGQSVQHTLHTYTYTYTYTQLTLCNTHCTPSTICMAHHIQYAWHTTYNIHSTPITFKSCCQQVDGGLTELET